MTVHAVGAYIEAVRTQNRIGVSDVVAAMARQGIETTPTYVWRIENGKISSPGAHLLAAMTRAVGGSMEHIVDLLLDKAAGPTEGRALADRWAETRQRQQGLYERRQGYGPPPRPDGAPPDDLAEEVTLLIAEVEARYAATALDAPVSPQALFRTLRVMLANWPSAGKE